MKSTESLPAPSGGPVWKNPRAVFWMLMAAALLLRLCHLDYRGLWLDEIKTLASIRLPTGEMIRERANFGHFPLYYLLLKVWRAVCGESEWMLRAPSALVGFLSIIFVYLFVRRGYGEWPALIAAAFYLMNERMLWASQEARPYALTFLAVAGSFHALAIAWETRRSRWWAVYAGWILAGLLSFGAFVFVYVGQILVMAVWQARRRRWRADWAVISGVLIVVAVLSLLWLNSMQINTRSFSAARAWPQWSNIREGLLQLFWGEFDLLYGSAFKYFGLPLIVVFMALAWRRRYGLEQNRSEASAPYFALACAWAVAILVGMHVVSALIRNVVDANRYYAAGVGGAAVVQGLAVAGLRRPRGRALLLLGCLAVQASVCGAWFYDGGDQLREAVRFVAEHRTPGAPVFFCNGDEAPTACAYYRLGVAPVGVRFNVRDEGVLLGMLEDNVKSGADFWLILYKEKDSPILDVARGWARAAYAIHEKTFRRARVFEFQFGRNKSGAEPD